MVGVLATEPIKNFFADFVTTTVCVLNNNSRQKRIVTRI